MWPCADSPTCTQGSPTRPEAPLVVAAAAALEHPLRLATDPPAATRRTQWCTSRSARFAASRVARGGTRASWSTSGSARGTLPRPTSRWRVEALAVVVVRREGKEGERVRGDAKLQKTKRNVHTRTRGQAHTDTMWKKWSMTLGGLGGERVLGAEMHLGLRSHRREARAQSSPRAHKEGATNTKADLPLDNTKAWPTLS